MSGKLVLFLLQLTTKKSFWATLATILLTIIGFIGFLIFVVFGTALAGTYTAEDDVILAVDAQYSNMENPCQALCKTARRYIPDTMNTSTISQK